LKELESPSQSGKSARSREEGDLSPGAETAFDVTKLPDAPAESYQPAPLEPRDLRPRLFDRAIVRNSGITSFTGLIRGHDMAPESPDYDSIETPQGDETEVEIEAPLTGIFAFPHGTRPGTCLHQIFEELDFCNLDNMPDIVSRNLRTFSIGNFDDIVCEMIRKTVSVPLEIGRSDFTLSRITLAERLQELEFYFPISSVTPAKLMQAFAEHCEYFAGAIPSTIDRLQFRPMSGFMKGFIDLLFEFEGKVYLLDWKSNWLGPNLDAYASASIGAEMTRRFYTLQLSIYTVAVHRFLQFRKPGYDYEEHFGGAYYLFLRGIEPGRPELGIHRMKLPADFVDKLSTLFMS
jgi:exodeoxyribonuclease V beta subunit